MGIQAPDGFSFVSSVAGSASQRGWGPGWPNCSDDKMIPLDYPTFTSTARVRGEVQDLMHRLLAETEDRGYSLHGPITDDWAYSCRAIKRPDGSSSSTPSNHSWGLALDLNATKNPNTSGPLVTDMPKWMVDMWNRFGFRWGGDYRLLGGSTVDAMHYEFMGTPVQAHQMTVKARAEGIGVALTPEQMAKFHQMENFLDTLMQEGKFATAVGAATIVADATKPHDHVTGGIVLSAGQPAPKEHTHGRTGKA